MISLLILKSLSRGLQYDIGSYIWTLTGLLHKSVNVGITIVSYKSFECKQITVIKESEKVLSFDIPGILKYSSNAKDADKKYAPAVVRILSEFIPKDGYMIFEMNYFDNLKSVVELKKKYLYPRINVVHFAHYKQFFNVNRNKLDVLNIDKPTTNIEFTLSKEKEFYLTSNHIVPVYGDIKNFLMDISNIDPIKNIFMPNGIDYKQYHTCTENGEILIRNKIGFSDDEIMILFSGRIDLFKGVNYLIKAFQSACRQKDNLRLVLLGNGILQEFQSLLKSYFGKIFLTGFLHTEQISLFCKIDDIGIILSIYDHCPYTVIEIIASRWPLIMSGVEGLKEILDNSECRFIYPHIASDCEISLDTEVLYEMIHLLVGDVGLRKKLSDRLFRVKRKNTQPTACQKPEKNFLPALYFHLLKE